MNDSALQAQVGAAEAYEAIFVQAIISKWAEKVADTVQLQPGDRILDVACGTGVFAREAARRVAGRGSVSGVDINPGMLAVARRLGPEIDWRQGSAEELPFPDEMFDAVVCQFGLMFFQDRHKAVQEMRRVLAPGGRLAAAVWSSLESTPGYAAEVDLVRRMVGDRAAQALTAPFVLGDAARLADLCERAGLRGVSASVQLGQARFPDVRTMMEGDLRAWLPLVGIELSDEAIDRILAEAGQALSAFITEQGEVVFDLPAVIVTGRK